VGPQMQPDMPGVRARRGGVTAWWRLVVGARLSRPRGGERSVGPKTAPKACVGFPLFSFSFYLFCFLSFLFLNINLNSNIFVNLYLD
jgi:hypothetical protein